MKLSSTIACLILAGVFACAHALAQPSNQAPADTNISIDGLPIIESGPADPRGKPLAVFVSGDGGWARIDRRIGNELVAQGVNVVGLDSLKYFWKRKTPDQVASDLSRIITWYVNKWSPSKVSVIGFSRGADVAPFMINRLPEKQRGAIDTLVLLSPGTATSFQFHLTDWLHPNRSSPDKLPIKPEADRLAIPNMMCFYGEDEAETSLCPLLSTKQFKIVKTPGGHHLDGEYKSIVQQIIAKAT